MPPAKNTGRDSYENLAVIAYNALAGGLLTGKHNQAAISTGTRFDKNPMYQEGYWHPENFAAVAKLRTAADQAGRSLISVALNWLLHHTVTDCVILGLRSSSSLIKIWQLARKGRCRLKSHLRATKYGENCADRSHLQPITAADFAARPAFRRHGAMGVTHGFFPI